MSTPRRRLAAVAVTAGLAAAPAQALAAPSHESATSPRAVAAAAAKRSPKTISAKKFLTRATQANLFEIQTGQLAQQRARSAQVKALGQMFIADHTKLNATGAAVAQKLGITPPTTVNRIQRKLIVQLQGLSGRRFDRAWIAAQLVAHAQSLRLNLRGGISGKPAAAIRPLGQSALPVITMHLAELEDLAT